MNDYREGPTWTLRVNYERNGLEMLYEPPPDGVIGESDRLQFVSRPEVERLLRMLDQQKCPSCGREFYATPTEWRIRNDGA